jgi:hypothetical protein
MDRKTKRVFISVHLESEVHADLNIARSVRAGDGCRPQKSRPDLRRNFARANFLSRNVMQHATLSVPTGLIHLHCRSAVLSSAGNSFLGRSRDPKRLILFAEAF